MYSATSGAWDVAFVTVNRERREREKRVAFGATYLVSDSTYLVPPGSPIQSIAGGSSGVRVAARVKSTQAVHLSTTLKHATLLLAAYLDEHLELLRSSKAAVLASARTVLVRFAAELPGSRVLDGSFDSLAVAVAVPQGRLATLPQASEFIETAKKTRVVLRAFENAGLKDATVAPAGQ
jgi:polar amino acid transport system substrate-binding protein